MNTKDILCTTDLTEASDTALACALCLASRADSKVTLMHVQTKGEEKEEAIATMEHQISRLGGGERVRTLLETGNYMECIAEESSKGHALVVVGTHGPRGLRQHLFGADILKLVRRMAIPALVVQEASPRDNNMNKIVIPVAAHKDINKLLDIVCGLARLHTSEVHVFQLIRPNEDPSEDLLNNKRDMLYRMQDEGIRHVDVSEPSAVFSVGFAEPTIRYAARIGANCIAIMAHASDEYRYIADAEKERLLCNEAHIPILCA